MKSFERFKILKTYIKIDKVKKTKNGIKWFLEYKENNKIYKIKKYSNINISNESFEQFLSELKNIGSDFTECPDLYNNIDNSIDIIFNTIKHKEKTFIFGSIRKDIVKDQISVYFIRSLYDTEYFKQNLHQWL